MFPPDAALADTSTTRLKVAHGTGCCVNSRTERRVSIASVTLVLRSMETGVTSGFGIVVKNKFIYVFVKATEPPLLGPKYRRKMERRERKKGREKRK